MLGVKFHMSINQVAIIVHENEQAIKELAQKMHLWVAATEKSKAVIEALGKLDTPKEFELSHYDVPVESTAEEKCLIAIDLVEDHHSSVFGAEPWLEIQVHGCDLTQKLEAELKEFGNTTLVKQGYGFNVTRTSE
jgi:hypothetical protein